MKEIILCGRKSGCCPTVSVQDDGVIMTNDEGETLVLSLEEWEILKNSIINGEYDE